jgi:hypothetical protein
VANRLIDAVKQSDAYLKGDDAQKAALLAAPVETLKDILAEEIDGPDGATKAPALHDVLVERVALQDAMAQRNRIVGDDYNFRSEDILDLAELDAGMGKLEEAKQEADKAVALQDARGAEASQDYYEVLILVRALQDSAEASLGIGFRDKASALFAAAIAPSERAAKVIQAFEAGHARPLAAETAEALALLTLAGAHMYSDDLAGALAPMTSANALYERLSLPSRRQQTLVLPVGLALRHGQTDQRSDPLVPTRRVHRRSQARPDERPADRLARRSPLTPGRRSLTRLTAAAPHE